MIATDLSIGRYIDGIVTIYRNADIVAAIPLRAADVQFFAGKGGRSGISSTLASDSLLDNFRAATIAP